jgi:hypothetical protein
MLLPTVWLAAVYTPTRNSNEERINKHKTVQQFARWQKPMEGWDTLMYGFTDTASNTTWLVICNIIHVNASVCSLQLLTTRSESRVNQSETCFKQYWFWCCGHSFLWAWSCGELSVDSLSQEMDSAQRKFCNNTTKVQYRLKSRPQWPRGVSHMSVATRLLGLWVRNPQGAWMSRLWVSWFVL